MSGARVRVVVAVVLFLGWIGWLGYMAFSTSGMAVVSRPQVLTANVVVIAKIEANKEGKPYREVDIVEVLYAPENKGNLEKGDKLGISNLDEMTKKQGWHGDANYVLLLTDLGGRYRVHPIPNSPGFSGNPYRIYKVTPPVLAQVEAYLAKREE